ncbi:MAG: GNAT family N-acetyltransferase [Candidatus Thiodiazotropha lotti]|nr:GNAT family N-acetyltransferase [Candidatus Thiodiazotropha lotti]
MKDHPLSVIWEPGLEETAAVRQGLTQFGIEALGGTPPKNLAVLLKSNQGRVIGGATGQAILNHFYLQQLWIDATWRSQGYGSRVLRKVEQAATESGCETVTLDTLNPKSMPFYEQHGYRAISEITDFIPGFTRVFYKKRLTIS